MDQNLQPKVCPNCRTPNHPGFNFCANCGNGLSGIAGNADYKNVIQYIIIMIIFLVAESLIWELLNLLSDYSSQLYRITSKLLSYLSALVWYTFPMIFAILLPRKHKAKQAILIIGILYLVFRLSFFIYYQMRSLDFIDFKF